MPLEDIKALAWCISSIHVTMFTLIVLLWLLANYHCISSNAQETTKASEQPTCGPKSTPEIPTTTPTQPNTSRNAGIDNFEKGNIKFTAKFFQNVVQANPGKSVVMSAYSTLFLLALLGYFADGTIQKELLTAMNFKNKDEIPKTIPAILDLISEQSKVNLTLAARVYGNIRSKFSDDFNAESIRIIRAGSESLDYSKPAQAAEIINKWVADNTNNKIQDLVPPSALNSNTQMVLTNALYFLGEWIYKFDESLTRKGKFYKNDNTTVMIDMMNQVENFKYADVDYLNAQALELPYVNGNLSCLVLLPRKIDGVLDLVAKLTGDNVLSSVLSSLRYRRVDVSLPKFKTTTSINLKDIFTKVGISAIFTEGIPGILRNGRRALVTAALQKATIEVDEKGSEAAAANAIIVGEITSVGAIPPPPIRFNANRFFVYYLLFRRTPIFCGLYAGN